VRLLFLGDTHRNPRFLAAAFEAAKREGCEQIIQLGDFGYGWQWLALGEGLEICKFSAVASVLVDSTGIELWFIDGNHENFDRLALQAVAPDGSQEVAPGVRHLARGQRFELGGCSFLALGGATSLDRMARTEGRSWWAAEAITTEDVAACGTEPVDVLVCHDAPLESGLPADRHSSGFGMSADIDWYLNRLRLSEVLAATSPDLVIHGHLHRRYELDPAPERPARIVGLASDAQGIEAAGMVFDTESRLLSPVV
jgi:predicted phosphodiesterase